MGKVYKEQEVKRLRIADLLRAQTPINKIAEIVEVDRKTVFNVKCRLAADDDLSHKSSGPPPNKKLTPEFLEGLKADFKANPFISINKMAKIKGVASSTLSLGVKKVGMKSKVRPLRQLLTGAQKAKRKVISSKLVSKLKKLKRGIVKIFSDKKNFTVDQAHNRRNDRAVVEDGEEVPPICRTKHPAYVMVLGVVGSDGQKCPLYFFKEGMRMKAEDYIKVLKTHVLPWLKKAYPRGNYVFQQDGARPHTANKTREWLKANFADFWDKDLWPPNSPDLNPLDYGIWGEMDRVACATPHSSVQTLTASIKKAWKDLSPNYVEKTCAAFRRRLEAVIEADGGHIE